MFIASLLSLPVGVSSKEYVPSGSIELCIEVIAIVFLVSVEFLFNKYEEVSYDNL